MVCLWLLAVYLRTQGMVGEVLFVGGGTVGGVGPDIASGVVLVDQFRQQRAVVTGGIGDSPAADQSMPAVDAEMVFIAESRNREIDPGFAVPARLGLGVLERPARILLPQFGRFACPVGRDAALLDLTLFARAVALLWRGDDLDPMFAE